MLENPAIAHLSKLAKCPHQAAGNGNTLADPRSSRVLPVLLSGQRFVA